MRHMPIRRQHVHHGQTAYQLYILLCDFPAKSHVEWWKTQSFEAGARVLDHQVHARARLVPRLQVSFADL